MNTFRTIFALLFIGSLFQSCDDPIVGSDTIITEEQTIDSFTSVDIEGIFETKIIRSEESKVVIKANENLLDRISINVSNEILKLRLEDENYTDIEIEVTIFTPIIQDVDLDGIGGLDIFGFLDLETLRIEHTGLGEIKLSEGSAKTFHIEMDNIGSLEAFDFESEEVTFQISGMGAARITSTSKLSGELSGVGNLYYQGYPEIMVEVNGLGDVIDAN